MASRFGRATALAALLVGGCEEGREIARIPLHELGEADAVGVSLAVGTPVWFSVSAEEVVYAGQNHLRLDVEFLDEAKVVGTFDCRGFRVDAGSGSMSRAKQTLEGCETAVPSPRATAIRVTAKPERPSRFHVTRLIVGVRTEN